MASKKNNFQSKVSSEPDFTFNFRQNDKKEKSEPEITVEPHQEKKIEAIATETTELSFLKNFEIPSPTGNKANFKDNKNFVKHPTQKQNWNNTNNKEKNVKAKNNRFVSLATGNVDWRKNQKLDIPANISSIEKAPNNYLYIAENEKGIIKVGVTKNNPYERVESFSQYYPEKFRLVTFFNIKNLDRVNVETFFHEILNSQFLNINYLSRVLPQINESHKKIVENRLNGYTELFVENKTILKNLLIFLNLIDVIDLKLYDIEEVSKIKDYQLGDVKIFKRTKKDLIEQEKNKISPIKPVVNNKQNLLLKNAKFFFAAIDYKDLKHLSFEINADKILFKLKSKELLITNFIYTNLAPDLTQALIKTKIYRAVHFTNLVEHIANLRKLNARVSTQYQDKALDGAPSVKKAQKFQDKAQWLSNTEKTPYAKKNDKKKTNVSPQKSISPKTDFKPQSQTDDLNASSFKKKTWTKMKKFPEKSHGALTPAPIKEFEEKNEASPSRFYASRKRKF